MKTQNFLKQMPMALLFSGALMFSSCENTNQPDRNSSRANNQNTVGATDETGADTYEMTDADYNTRRNRVSSNLENEITRSRTELETLRERINTSSNEELEGLNKEVDRLESRIERLEEQQNRLEESTQDNWEETEREAEGVLQDRDGTSTENNQNLNRDAGRTGSAINNETGTDTRIDNQNNDAATNPQGDMDRPTDNAHENDIDRTDRTGNATEENRTGNTNETGSESGNVY